MNNLDAIVEEGLTVDSLFPASQRCKDRLGNRRVDLPIMEMTALVETLRADGFVVEVREQNGYAFQCVG